MVSAPGVLFARVRHARLQPKPHRFDYGVCYFALALGRIAAAPLAHNRPALLSFYDRDHGGGDGNLTRWARGILAQYSLGEADGEIVLICMPRVLGYVFNPVSFWLCFDRGSRLRAVLCEVNNTFGERHTYLCAHPDHRVIGPEDVLEGEKVFHVSPLLRREGRYQFRFDTRRERVHFRIDYWDATGNKTLTTALIGAQQAMSRGTLRRAFWRYPLLSFRVIFLIHWQALKLALKGVGFTPKPAQKAERLSTTRALRKGTAGRDGAFP